METIEHFGDVRIAYLALGLERSSIDAARAIAGPQGDVFELFYVSGRLLSCRITLRAESVHS